MKIIKNTNIADIVDTKERILFVATKLFAENGFDGTSVRDLAGKAEVNNAAINYHFQNKENLYREVLLFGINEFEKKCKELFLTKSWTTPEFAEALYEMLFENGDLLINNFKVMLNDFPVVEGLKNSEKMVAPPGSEYICACMEQDLKRKLNPEDQLWACRVIFTFIAHTALMASTQYGKYKCDVLSDKNLTLKSLKRLVNVVLSDL